jgi:hypothetical protein
VGFSVAVLVGAAVDAEIGVFPDERCVPGVG